MAERGFGRGGARGGAKGGRKGKQGMGPKDELSSWNPLTKLGRLVKGGRITSIEEIFRFAIPIKESQIVDFFLKDKLKEDVMQVMPVQKQTCAGQRTRFKVYVVVGNEDGLIGLGSKVAAEVRDAIKGGIIDAKLNIVPIRRGYWGNKIGKPHTVPCKVTGKSGSVRIRLVPAPRGTGIVGAPISKKVLQMAGIQDSYSSSQGKTKTRGNFLKATFNSITKTYRILTPDFWGKTKADEFPFEQHSKFLREYVKSDQKQQ